MELDELVSSPPWMADALCREFPEIDWFPARGGDLEPARAVCARCAVHYECLAYALEESIPLVGVWGGTSPAERRRLGHRRAS